MNNKQVKRLRKCHSILVDIKDIQNPRALWKRLKSFHQSLPHDEIEQALQEFELRTISAWKRAKEKANAEGAANRQDGVGPNSSECG